MTDARVEVLPVPEGSIIWLHNVDIPRTGEDDDFDLGTEIAVSLGTVIGHRKYAVVVTNGDGVIEVLGEDEIVARVRAALTPPTICTAIGTGIGGIHLSCVLPLADHGEQHLDPYGTRWGEL